MTAPDKPPRRTGIAHFLAAAGYSLGGLRRLARESAFRQEVLFIAGLLVIFLVAGASPAEIAGLLALGLALVAVEALNTAIEVLVDHLSPGWSEWAKDAKDLGSLAVACTIGATVLYAGIVLVF
ncbi:diacylglycerol kinase [Tabrizicola flagellatus]|uniref:diacylglycerol kinase n=1 Tax=Tabrizicola flagellatus TaxID=2593021 RepID=UPI0011F12139|nr:diacylglycerol kinase [Tabrizicola flagellatus]